MWLWSCCWLLLWYCPHHMTIVVPFKEGTVPGLQPQGRFLREQERLCTLQWTNTDTMHAHTPIHNGLNDCRQIPYNQVLLVPPIALCKRIKHALFPYFLEVSHHRQGNTYSHSKEAACVPTQWSVAVAVPSGFLLMEQHPMGTGPLSTPGWLREFCGLFECSSKL